MPKLWNKNKIYLSSFFQLLIWTSSGKSDYFDGKRGHSATEDVKIHPHTNESTKSPFV